MAHTSLLDAKAVLERHLTVSINFIHAELDLTSTFCLIAQKAWNRQHARLALAYALHGYRTAEKARNRLKQSHAHYLEYVDERLSLLSSVLDGLRAEETLAINSTGLKEQSITSTQGSGSAMARPERVNAPRPHRLP